MKRLLALLLSLLLFSGIVAAPAPAQAQLQSQLQGILEVMKDQPLTRASAALLLQDLFGLADWQTLNLPGFETTPRDLGYTATNGAIKAANVIPAAKDSVQLPEHTAIETVINAGLMGLDEDGLSLRPFTQLSHKDFFTLVARGYAGPDLNTDAVEEALALGLFTQEQLSNEALTFGAAFDIVEALKQDTQLLSVFATSDIHGNWLPYKSSDSLFQIGSAARIKAVLDSVRQRLGEENVLYVDGGDSPYNTTLANVTGGDVSVATLNALGLTATVLGNHDFDYSFDNLLRLAGEARYAMLSANTRYKDGHQPESAADVYPAELGDYIVVEAAGLKVGIFGVTDDQSAATTLYSNTENTQFDKDLEKAAEVVKLLKEEEQADLIIALSHLHSKNKDLLEQNPAVHISIGGGNDIAGRPTILGQDQYLINPGKHAEALTQINLVLYKGKIAGTLVNQLFLTEAYAEDEGVAGIIAGYNERVDKALDQTVGYLAQDLEWSAELVRTQNSPIARLVADALLDYFKPDGAQLCIVNGGGIRAKLDAGEVSLREITSVLPFDNNMMLVETSGQTVWDALQNGISAWPASNGKFPQVAGLSYVFRPGEPNTLISVTLDDGSPLDLAASYKVVINSFLAGGGDGYTMFNVLDQSKEGAKDVTQLVYVNRTYMRDALQAYLASGSSQDNPLVVDMESSRITIEE